MNHLIVGYGEIGKAVAGIINETGIDIVDEGFTRPGPNREFDIMHVCFPYGDEFTKQVAEYCDEFLPKYVIIYSTVAIGTTDMIANYIGGKIAHSPVEGKHPDLELSMRNMPRWIGVTEKRTGQYFTAFFEEKGLRTHVVDDPKFTEFLKLRSTSKYGINLMWADYEEGVASDLGMDFKLINEFDADYNKLYREMGLPQFQRYLVTPPNGKIGGHCVVPNAAILNEQYPNEFLAKLKGMG
jgi:UDP-N-acetyl-D-mannosaminuronate dehydrogenase